MIQTIVTHLCPRYESDDLVKNGRGYKNSQKYRCNSCHRYGTLNAQRGHSPKTRQQARRGLLERLRLRGLARMPGIAV